MQLKTRNILAAGAVAFLVPMGAHAAHISNYFAEVNELNGSGVSGRVDFAHDSDAQTLSVTTRVTGLVASMGHVNHIHGRFNDDGSARNSTTPTPASDTNGDGFVDVFEGLPSYGDILLSLEDPANLPDAVHSGPAANDAGEVSYSYTYDLNDPSLFFSPVSPNEYEGDDLFPLEDREYVIHGGFISDAFRVSSSGDAPGAGYRATLPVGAGEIQAVAAVPLPAGAVLLLTALGGLGFARRFRKAA